MENFATQMRKGILEYLILSLIKKGNAYGAEIIQTLTSGDLLVTEGTIYPILLRLKKDGLIDYYWLEGGSGHPRKYYNLTEKGSETLIIMEKSWNDIKNSVSNILKQ